MSKYESLWEHIISANYETVKMTFDEIEKVLGFKIDHSFLNYKKELLQFGYQVGKISMKEKTVLFVKLEIT